MTRLATLAFVGIPVYLPTLATTLSEEDLFLLQSSDRAASFGHADTSTLSKLAWNSLSSDADGVAIMRAMIDKARSEAALFGATDTWTELGESDSDLLAWTTRTSSASPPPTGYKPPMVLQKFTNVTVNCKGQVWNETIIDKKTNKTKEIFLKVRDYWGLARDRGTCSYRNDHWNPGPYPDDHAGPLPVVVILTQPQWGAFYHFMIDSLPRVMHIRTLEPALMEDPKVKFHTGFASPTAQAFARLLGIATEIGNSSRLICGTWKVDLAIWPPSQFATYLRPGSGKEPDATYSMSQALQAPARAALPAMRAEGWLDDRPVVLMIRRRHNRVIRNWNDSIGVLNSEFQDMWKVVVYDEDNLPDVPTTCALFHAASILVGVHGAGFANLVCARKQAIVVELQKMPHSRDFEFLGGQLGMTYLSMQTPVKLTTPSQFDLNLTAFNRVIHRAHIESQI